MLRTSLGFLTCSLSELVQRFTFLDHGRISDVISKITIFTNRLKESLNFWKMSMYSASEGGRALMASIPSPCSFFLFLRLLSILNKIVEKNSMNTWVFFHILSTPFQLPAGSSGMLKSGDKAFDIVKTAIQNRYILFIVLTGCRSCVIVIYHSHESTIISLKIQKF